VVVVAARRHEDRLSGSLTGVAGVHLRAAADTRPRGAVDVVDDNRGGDARRVDAGAGGDRNGVVVRRRVEGDAPAAEGSTVRGVEIARIIDRALVPLCRDGRVLATSTCRGMCGSLATLGSSQVQTCPTDPMAF